MDINELTIGQAKELAAMFGPKCEAAKIDNGMLGKYVIVRCRDAGVHAGVLEAVAGAAKDYAKVNDMATDDAEAWCMFNLNAVSTDITLCVSYHCPRKLDCAEWFGNNFHLPDNKAYSHHNPYQPGRDCPYFNPAPKEATNV
jgi:hypothetical protein